MLQHDKDEVNITRISSQPQVQVSQKGAYVVIAIVVIVLIAIIGAIASGVSKTSEELNANTGETNQTKGLSTEEYAQKAEKAYLESWGFSSFSEMAIDPDMPVGSDIRYINGFEGISVGTVRVYVQKDITKEEATAVGKNVLGTLGLDMQDLDFIVVRGIDGLDVNVSRSTVPGIN